MVRLLIALTVFFSAVNVGNAAPIIFNGGAPVPTNGNETTQWVQAEDFSLSQASSLTDGHFWTGEFGNWDGTLQYFIFANGAGQPGALLVSGNGQNVVKTLVGVTGFGANMFEYSFDLQSPVALAASTTYWFGIHLSSNFNRDEIYWVTTSPGFGLPGSESFGGTFNNWANNGQQHAFFLTGSPVPEPASMLAWGLIAGVGAVGYRMRKRRSQAVAA